MSGTGMKRIEALEARPGFRLAVTWEDHGQQVISFVDDIRKGGVWEALRDETKFAMAHIASRRRSVEWPEPKDADGDPIIEIDADALFRMAERQKVTGFLARLMAFFDDRRAVLPEN